MSKEQKYLYDRETKSGRVTLVGAGRGAVDRLSLRGQRALAAAEVVVYDDLANPALLDFAPESARRIYVGKRAGQHSQPQERITAILIEEARGGAHVVRLKGGDPLVFGRGGEEMQALAAEGIPYDVVPGVTAAIAAGAGTGIPLTHRDHASAVIFVTGHECAGKAADRPGAVHPVRTEEFLGELVSLGLVVPGEIEVDVGHLVSVKAHERFERDVESVSMHLRPAVGTILMRQVDAGSYAAVIKHLEAMTLGTNIVRRQRIDFRDVAHGCDERRTDGPA